MISSVEKISLMALAGIFFAVLSLFLGKADKNSEIIINKEASSSSPVQPHLDLARLYFGKDNYILAISEYRKAIEIKPNYIDEKDTLFLGDEIKNAIKKTIFELTEKEKQNPGDKIVKQGLKDAYYLRRRFGRGCE